MAKLEWKKANDPPTTKTGYWSKEVIVITNYKDTFVLAYFGEKDGGVWQRPERFSEGEKVELWTEMPNVN